jgi:hypothetical protein
MLSPIMITDDKRISVNQDTIRKVPGLDLAEYMAPHQKEKQLQQWPQ